MRRLRRRFSGTVWLNAQTGERGVARHTKRRGRPSTLTPTAIVGRADGRNSWSAAVSKTSRSSLTGCRLTLRAQPLSANRTHLGWPQTPVRTTARPPRRPRRGTVEIEDDRFGHWPAAWISKRLSHDFERAARTSNRVQSLDPLGRARHSVRAGF